MSGFEERRVTYYNDIPLRGSFIYQSNQMERSLPYYNDYYLDRSNGYLFDRTMAISTNKNHQPIIYPLMNTPLRKNYSYAIEDYTSQTGSNRIVRMLNENNVTFYDNYVLTNSYQRQPQFSRRTRIRPYNNKHCSVIRAKKIAKRLKDKEDYEEAIDDLCFLMNVRNKQPLDAVIKELVRFISRYINKINIYFFNLNPFCHRLLLLLEYNKVDNTSNNSDKSTQTAQLQCQGVKKECFTPIPQGFLRNMVTPTLPTKMTVKLEKITPICE